MLLIGFIDVPVWLLLLIGIVIGLYFLGTRNHDYFKKRGIPGPKPLPFIGTIHYFLRDMYNSHLKLRKEHGKVIGTFLGSNPGYSVFDEEMITQICVKQFHNFVDRRNKPIGDNAFDLMLTVLKGDHWKHVRSKMSPAFTTGKLRLMAAEINRGGKALVKNILSKSEPFEAKSVAGAFTMDVIASTAFGLRIESQDSEDNAFITNGKAITNISLKNPVVLIMIFLPKLARFLSKLGLSVLDRNATKFFMSILNQTFEGRYNAEDQHKSRTDFIQLMVKAKQGDDIRDKEEQEKAKEETPETTYEGMTKDEILSNALLFFFAGYDTTSAGLGYLMYHLACNPECQEKLIQEVDSVVGNEDEIDYHAAMKLHYLDQCIQESLRLHPPVIVIDRVALCDTDVCGVQIAKGCVVNIPIRAIHYDPDIWSDPTKFDPERFSPENKPHIHPCHWMPFGYGPRNCIGMRLALLEIKISIATLLKSHRLATCEKTEFPIKLSKTTLMKPQNGIYLTVEKR